LRRSGGESYQASTGCNDDAHQRLLLGRAASRIAKRGRGAKPRSSASIAREDEHDREQRDHHREASKGLHGSIAGSRESLDQRHGSATALSVSLGIIFTSRPYSGKIPLRVSPETHRRAATRAQAAGMSPNQWSAHRIRDWHVSPETAAHDALRS
jgi:hypothetical protein